MSRFCFRLVSSIFLKLTFSFYHYDLFQRSICSLDKESFCLHLALNNHFPALAKVTKYHWRVRDWQQLRDLDLKLVFHDVEDEEVVWIWPQLFFVCAKTDCRIHTDLKKGIDCLNFFVPALSIGNGLRVLKSIVDIMSHSFVRSDLEGEEANILSIGNKNWEFLFIRVNSPLLFIFFTQWPRFHIWALL